MRSLRKATTKGPVIVLMATEKEITMLIEATDAKRRFEGEGGESKAWGDLRSALIEARYGKLPHA